MRQLKLLKLSAVAALALPSVAAMAADGNVTVSGAVASQTCTVSVNGSSSPNPGGSPTHNVQLPTVSRSALPSIGATAGTTPFSISVSNCTGPATSMNTYFEPGSGSINPTGRLSNTGVATGVEVEISTDTGAMIHLNRPFGKQGTSATLLTAGAATQNFIARYYATAATGTDGSFIGNFAYSIIYQ